MDGHRCKSFQNKDNTKLWTFGDLKWRFVCEEKLKKKKKRKMFDIIFRAVTMKRSQLIIYIETILDDMFSDFLKGLFM